MRIEAMQPGKSLRNVLIAVFAMVFAFHIPALYRYTQLRHDIERRYIDAAWAKRMVEDSALAGSISELPTETNVGLDQIYISTETGVVTVAFGGLPPDAGATLKMLPIVVSGGERYPLSAYMKSGRSVRKGEIFWACSSSVLRSLEAYIKENQGTLVGELAPAECRYITWLGLQSPGN